MEGAKMSVALCKAKQLVTEKQRKHHGQRH